MRGLLRTVTLVLLAVGGLSLAACGDASDNDAKNAYVRQLNRAQQQFADAATTISTQDKAQSIGQYRHTLQRLKKSIDDFAAKLRRIQPPAEARAEHDLLVSALDDYGSDFGKVAQVLDNPSPSRLDEAQREIGIATQRANQRIDAATAAIDSKLRTS